jgi:hypothetical protein
MTDSQLDTAYTALANAIARTHAQAPATAQLFLATLVLSLMAKQADDTQCLHLIAQAEHLATA